MNSEECWQQSTKPTRRFFDKEIVEPHYAKRGFLPEQDPLRSFPPGSPYAMLNELGADLPSLLHDKGFRQYARALTIPAWEGIANEASLPELRLYYVRLGFLASAYINQVGQEPSHQLPANIAKPLVRVGNLLGRPPILSYDGYALYNWKRFDPGKPIQLGNLDTLQNFVHLYDEHWFILVHVEIEALAAETLGGISGIYIELLNKARDEIGHELWRIADALARQVKVLKRIPEKMDAALYFKAFRPYIRFFENVEYQGVDRKPLDFRGETGAQSSVMPVLEALMKIPHAESSLTAHLDGMRQYMPAAHARYVKEVAALPNLRCAPYRGAFNAVLDGMQEFRDVHYGFAKEYINKHVADPRGTGGTPYMRWLKQLQIETQAYKL